MSELLVALLLLEVIFVMVVQLLMLMGDLSRPYPANPDCCCYVIISFAGSAGMTSVTQLSLLANDDSSMS